MFFPVFFSLFPGFNKKIRPAKNRCKAEFYAFSTI